MSRSDRVEHPLGTVVVVPSRMTKLRNLEAGRLFLVTLLASVGSQAFAAPTIGSRVFVDTSGSVAGFFGRQGATSLTALHAEIDAALVESGFGSAKKCSVGTDARCGEKSLTNAELSNAKFFHDTASRLDRVIGRAATPSRIDPNNPPPADFLDDARVTILVTDGMQASSGGSDTNVCAHGADPACVASLLRARAREGFGIWIVGALLPFSGTHFPERALTPEYLEEARKHVDSLKFESKNLGVDFAIKGGLGGDGKTGNSTYAYQGYKPLLVFVFSKEHAQARRFVASLTKKVIEAPLRLGKMHRQDTVQSVELAPLQPSSVTPTTLTLSSVADQKASSVTPDALAELKVVGAAPITGGLAAKVSCGAKGRAMLDLQYTLASDGSLPSYMASTPVLRVDAATPPRVLLNATGTAGKIKTGLNCAPLAKQSWELHATIEAKVDLHADATSSAWWSRSGWSSEDTWKMPERLYGLEDIVMPLLRDRAAKPTHEANVVIHVDRQ